MKRDRTGERARRLREKREGEGGFSFIDLWWKGLGGFTRDLIVVGLLALATVIFFRQFLFSDRMLYGSDILPMGYAARKIFADFVRAHLALPFWNPYILGGLPFAESFHGDIFYPASLLYLVFPVHRAIGMKLVLHVFLAGVTMYVYLRGLTLERRVALVGGVAYMFTPYLVSLVFAGHDAKMYVTALFPLFLYALERLGRGGGLYHAALGGLAVGLMLLSAHVQMAYFALWGGAIYTAVLLVRIYLRERTLIPVARAAGLAALMVALGLAVGMVQLLPSYLYTKEFSPRAGGVEYSYAASWSLHPEEAASLVVPEFGGYMGNYSGRNPFKLNCESPGVVVVFLAVVGLLWHRRWPFYVALGIGVLALAYALGAHTPVHGLFFRLAPGVKMMRAPSIIMFLFSWAMVTMAALGLSHFASEGGRKGEGGRPEWLLILAAVFAGLFLRAAALGDGLHWLWVTLFYRDISPQARQVMMENVPAVRVGLLWATALVAGAALALWFRRYLGRCVLALALVVLVAAGDWRIGGDFVRPVRLEDHIAEDELVRHLQRDPDLFRVLPMTGRSFDQNYLPVFGIQTANGFHDNRMASYDLLLQDEDGPGFRALALLNVKYVVTPEATARALANHPVLSEETGIESPWGHLFLNRAVLPRAFVVHRYRVLSGEDAREELLRGDMNLGEEIILGEDPGLTLSDPPAEGPRETVEILSYTMREARLRVQARAPGLLYFGDNYFPAWRALVDGEEAPLLRANLTFRAVPIPPGVHEVEFRYRSPVLRASLGVSLASGLLLLGILVGGPALARRRRRRGSRGDRERG